MKFEEKLMSLRKAKGWSQEDLSNQIGVSRQTISKWESSQTTPEMNKLIELSKIFEISVDELINDVDEETSATEEKVYTKINLKPTNILLIIACVLIVIGVACSIGLYLSNKDSTYVEDVIMITYIIKMQDEVEVVEIYSFNSKDECIGFNTHLKTNNNLDYEDIVNDINQSKNLDADMRYNIILNRNEVSWSNKIYEKISKEKILKQREADLSNFEDLKIIDM